MPDQTAPSLRRLLDPSELPYALPPFTEIVPADYVPAIELGMAEQIAAVDAIVADPATPTFANTLEPLERSGLRLRRALRVFGNLASADATEEIERIDAELSPKLAAHRNAITLNPGLYARLQAVEAAGEQLPAEAAYLLEKSLLHFRLAGAGLTGSGRDRLQALNVRISELETAFRIELQADTNELALSVDSAAELDGLTPGELSATSATAASRGRDGHVVTLVLPTAHPYLSALTRSEVRGRLSEAQRARGSRGGEHDTRPILLELARLRAERARLLGFASHAELATADTTAGSPEAARDLLMRLAGPAAANAREEQAALERIAGHPIEASDWPFYAERRRSSEFDIDLTALRPYFEAERVLRNGVFYAAGELFGLRFSERTDLHGYHPDVRVFEVREADDTPVGLYLLDLYARDTKRGGAWMNSLVDRASLAGSATAIIVNNLNVPKPAEGEPTLLTFEQTKTLFHEFGHALHGLLAEATYPSFAGTSVPRDFVEFPSQLNEMWMLWPQTLRRYAVHHETGEPIPDELVDRLQAAQAFNEGFLTSEYLAAAIIDLAWHSLAPEDVPGSIEEIPEFERAALAAAGLDNPAVPSRYASPYFAHIFGGGYSAGYYSYIWAEVLDADTAEWFESAGGLRAENGDAYRRHVIGFGGTREPLSEYLEWRGRPAPIEPLLTRRGLAAATS